MSRKATGTREWAAHSLNCIAGCSHRCIYCYANAMAARFGRVHPDGWGHEVVNEAALAKRVGKRKGTIMFPTTHDITADNVNTTGPFLCRLLEAGNHVVVVSKPCPRTASVLSAELLEHADRLLFRFTIGADDDRILSFWEPGAPSFHQRLEALRMMRSRGFRTSVSMEPLLEIREDRTVALFGKLAEHVTEDIWIGKLNKGEARLRANGNWNETTAKALRALEASQSDDRIRSLVARLDGHPLVKWKESVKAVAGITLAEVSDDRWTERA